METIPIERLADGTCAVTSGETFKLVMRERDTLLASESNTDQWNNFLRNFGNSTRTTKFHIAAIEFLGRLVLYDFVAIEEASIPDLYRASKTDWLTLIKKIVIPDSVYEMASRLATDALYLSNKAWEKKSKYDFIEKRFLENLSARGVHIREQLRNSDYPGTRLYFYIVLSAIYKVPLILDSNKNDALKDFAGDIRKSVHDTYAQIEKDLADPIRKKIEGKLHEIGEEIPLRLPPLVNYIFKIAIKHKLSLWDATLKIRETRDAEAFRKFLRELEKTRTSDILAYQKQRQVIHDLGQGWAENLNTAYGVTKTRSRVPVGFIASLLSFGSFDLMADLLKLKPLRDAELSFPDKLLRPEPHFVFLSKLFEPEVM